jgi:hypothetical protein
MKKQPLLFIILAILSIWVAITNLQSYQYPTQKDLQLKINYLSNILQKPLGNDSELIKIKTENHEWALFSLSFSTFAATNIAFLDTSFHAQSIEMIDNAIQKAVLDTIYQDYFQKNNPFYPKIDPNGSVLYFGHLNMMLGCYRLLSKNPKYNALNDHLSKSLYERFQAAPFHCLHSYIGKIWMSDNIAGLASLQLHSQNTGSNYQEMSKIWVKYAQNYFTDTHTGLLCSTIHPETGAQLEAPRGSMIGWSIFFMSKFDKSYARSLYENYKNKYSDNLPLIQIFKERYQNNDTDTGDIDSGPIFYGYSIPANAFAFGDAVAMKDWVTAKKLQRLIKMGSKRVVNGEKLQYNTRLVELPISPLAESVLLYMETMVDWGG